MNVVGKTGDGAGIHIEIPTDFFIEKIEATGHKHNNSDLCVGMIFLPRNDYQGQEQSRTIVESELTKKNFNIYTWVLNTFFLLDPTKFYLSRYAVCLELNLYYNCLIFFF